MKNFRQFPLIAIFYALVSLSANAEGPTLYSPQPQNDAHKEIAKSVEKFVHNHFIEQGAENISVSAFPLDKRITLATCNQAYDFAMTDSEKMQAYSTVKVTCPDTAWYVFINVKVEELKRTVVTAEMISPGTLITKLNVRTADINTNKLRNTTYSDVSELEGARLKYRVREGQPVTPRMVCFVCKGDVITIAAKANGLTISTKGIAQQDGNRGDTIKVKNTRSEKVVLAKVQDHSTAVVNI